MSDACGANDVTGALPAERSEVVTAAVPASLIERGSDLHTHSTLTDGADSPAAMADAAAAAGLRVWGLSDHVRADSTWLDGYVPMVRALRRDGLEVRCGVEAKMLDAAGRLDLPAALPDLDYVLVADHQFPSPTGPLSPRHMTAALADGTWSARAVLDTLVQATCSAVRGAPAPAVVVHPFSLLPKMGLDESEIGDDHLYALAAACRAADAAVEINEKWRCPTPRVVRALLGSGVRMTLGSDAHRCADVGVTTYAHQLLGELVHADAPPPGAPAVAAATP